MTAFTALVALAFARPYKILPLPPQIGPIESELGGAESRVWLSGDILTIAHRRRANYVAVTGGVQEAMTPVPGRDLWVLRLEMKGWRQAVIQYAFFTAEKRVPRYEDYKVWRGPDAPEMNINPFVQGKLTKRPDGLTVYTPPTKTKNISVIFLVNGDSTEGFAQALEPLILSGRVRPCAIVGVSPARRKDLASLPAWATKTLGFASDPTDVAIMGFSSGGTEALRVAASAPAFGQVIALATGSYRPRLGLRAHFGVGTLDGALGPVKTAYERAKANEAGSTFHAFVGGHDFELWRLAFSRIAIAAFPPR